MIATSADIDQFALWIQRPTYVGRVRALAAALGVGTAVALSAGGIACADTASLAPTNAGAATGPARHNPTAAPPITPANHTRETASPAASNRVRNTSRPRPAETRDALGVSAQPSLALLQMPQLSLAAPESATPPTASASAYPTKANPTATAVLPTQVPAATAPPPSQSQGIAAAIQALLGGGGNGLPAVPADVITPALALIRRGLQAGLLGSGFTAGAAQTVAAAPAAFGRWSWKALPTLTISDSSLTEGNSGTTNMAFTVTLSKASTTTVAVDYATANGTATAGQDYLTTSGTITFAAGQTTKTVSVTVIGDTNVEPNETLTVTLSNPTKATIARAVATGTILNDDVAQPPVTGAQWGNAFYSPYVSMSNWPVPNLSQLYQASGASRMNVGFIQADSAGNPSWGGYSALEPTSTNSQAVAINQSISTFKAAGGDTMVSFGGATGTSLSQYYSAHNLSAQALSNVYAAVATTYGATHLDFDIEAGALTDTSAVALQTQAIKLLQQSHPALQVWFTLPVTPTGLTADSIKAVTSALQAGVKLAGVNVMAMDYGEYAAPTSGATAQTMGTYAIDAAQSTYAQLSALYGKYGLTYSWSQLGVTPMIGVNDVTTEVFTLTDAQTLEAFAVSKGIGMLSMWSLLRDNPGTLGQVSDSTSGLSAPSYSFSKVFDVYGTTATSAAV